MRVITGTARGRRLETLEGNDVRPTPERVKEAVFSAIQFDIEGRHMLDLFAGSGQMGIEALSRGAARVQFCDSSEASLAVLRRNLAATGFAGMADVQKADYASFLATTRQQFDIAFLDPPYHAGILADALVKTAAVMRNTGVILCEHPTDVALPQQAGGFTCKKQYKYGKIAVSLYRNEGE